VSYLLKGKIQKSENKVEIHAQLIDPKLAGGYALRGHYYFMCSDFDIALPYFEQLNLNSALLQNL
jgi:hypothetical protein